MRFGVLRMKLVAVSKLGLHSPQFAKLRGTLAPCGPLLARARIFFGTHMFRAMQAR